MVCEEAVKPCRGRGPRHRSRSVLCDDWVLCRWPRGLEMDFEVWMSERGVFLSQWDTVVNIGR
jgi:hypothetical protein